MAQKKQPTANRNYKDTVFRMLFSDRKNLLSLYNAISGAHYDNPEMLEIVTLENAIYMGMKNDLAFIIDTDLFLYEHQSTYNPNMPLRDLFYISSEYQKLVDKKISLFFHITENTCTTVYRILQWHRKEKRQLGEPFIGGFRKSARQSETGTGSVDNKHQ